MKLTLTPTEDVYRTVEGVLLRAWSGTTERGTRITAYVASLCVLDVSAETEVEFAVLQQMAGPPAMERG